MIGNDVLDCETVINGFGVQPGAITEQKATAIELQVTENNLMAYGLNDEASYQAELFSLDGKTLYQHTVSGPSAVLIDKLADRFNTGVYIIRLSGAGQVKTQKLFVK